MQCKHALPRSFLQSEALDDVINAARQLPANDDRAWKGCGRQKADRSITDRHKVFLSLISEEVNQVRTWFGKGRREGAPKPKIFTIMHDGWTSYDTSYYGISLAFINPTNWTATKVAIGLVACEGHTVLDAEEVLQAVLRTVGIKAGEIMFSVNDTCHAAKAAGRSYVSHTADEDGSVYEDLQDELQSQGTCVMHVANLVMEHALGLKVHSRKKVIVDEFAAGVALVKKLKGVVNYIWNLLAPGRAAAYSDRNKPNKVFNIELPGDTRVSGTQKLLQQLLRSFWTLKTYFALEADTDSEPAPNDWVTAAEFEAIMRPIARLAINVQTDQLTLSSSFLRQLECQIELNQDTYDIVDRTKPWPASTSFEDLPKRATRFEDMGPTAQEFVNRLRK